MQLGEFYFLSDLYSLSALSRNEMAVFEEGGFRHGLFDDLPSSVTTVTSLAPK